MNNQPHPLLRWWRHLTMTRWQLQHAFPETTLQAITASVTQSESVHGGEIRIAIEADLATTALWRQQTSRQRALEVFAHLGVWDTAARNGVLIYLCLADRAVEIIADRGLHESVSEMEWREICAQLQRDCAVRRFSEGVSNAVMAVGKLIGQKYPVTDRNEQPDRPVLL
jgi:uncharacterized membrane protein